MSIIPALQLCVWEKMPTFFIPLGLCAVPPAWDTLPFLIHLPNSYSSCKTSWGPPLPSALLAQPLSLPALPAVPVVHDTSLCHSRAHSVLMISSASVSPAPVPSSGLSHASNGGIRRAEAHSDSFLRQRGARKECGATSTAGTCRDLLGRECKGWKGRAGCAGGGQRQPL